MADFLDTDAVARYPARMTDLSPSQVDKFRRYRARKKAEGLREVRMWVPDVTAPAFWERSVRAAAALRDAPEEEDVMLFIEALHAEDRPWD